jgi:multicomponent Na+:H+ antiporter subunit G
MTAALDVAAAVLMLAGALSCLIGAIGLVRLPDLPARLQAATKPQTLGLSLVLLGAALRVELASAVTLVLVVLFQVITAPVVSQLVGRAAYRSGAVREDALVVDELIDHLPEDRAASPDEDGAGRRAGHDAATGGRAGRDGTS